MQRVGMNQHQLNQDELLRISRAISDTTRYALLEKIYFDQQITVGELCAESTVSAATVAHHIKILNDAGLIQVRRQGRYRLLVAQGNTWEMYLDCLANLDRAAPLSATSSDFLDVTLFSPSAVPMRSKNIL